MKILNQENFKKDLMNLTEANHQINMNSDHSVRSNKWLKSHLNANSFTHVFNTFNFRVCCKVNVNSALGENSKTFITNNINTSIILMMIVMKKLLM